ncbi:MAG TPA: glycosyltransferase family A protein [Desulfopila sp.]|nr:glycosyltransferase family A protein [Desulfopila sp.]
MEEVSVIIPTYNRADYLQRAVESVWSQQHFAGEILVVDDGSTDHSGEVIEKLSAVRPIRYVRTENRGVAAARNLGVSLAACNHIAFLDSDDHWVPGKLHKQMHSLCENNTFSISHTGEKWLRNGVHLNQKSIHRPQHGDVFSHCLRLCAVGMSTVIMTREVFLESGGFDTSLPCCEDYDLWLRLSCTHEFLLVTEALTVKDGGRNDQLSRIYRVGMDKFRIYAIEKLLKSGVLSTEQQRLALTELERKCRIYGNGCIKHGRLQEGRRYLAIPQKHRRCRET